MFEQKEDIFFYFSLQLFLISLFFLDTYISNLLSSSICEFTVVGYFLFMC